MKTSDAIKMMKDLLSGAIFQIRNLKEAEQEAKTFYYSYMENFEEYATNGFVFVVIGEDLKAISQLFNEMNERIKKLKG